MLQNLHIPITFDWLTKKIKKINVAPSQTPKGMYRGKDKPDNTVNNSLSRPSTEKQV